MSSTFDKFQFMTNQTNFDVITLSETWLKNDKHLLEYDRLPGYEFAYRNRDEKRGGGVGIYIRDTIEFKVRNGISKLDESIEHLWVEIQGRKKSSACLTGVFYQPSSENNKKLEWIEKLDFVLSIVKSTWNETFMITEDSNIDLLASTEIQKRYIEVLKTYDLDNHITKATRTGKKLVDHIISNIPANKVLNSDMLPCPIISDDDAPYAIANMPVNKFETRCKYIRNLKNFKPEKYVQDFKALLISSVYSFGDPNDQLDTLNKIILNTLNEHARLMKTKYTRNIPPAPWMKDFEINKLQRERDHWRHEAHSKQTPQS